MRLRKFPLVISLAIVAVVAVAVLLLGPTGLRHEPQSAEAALLSEVKKLTASDAQSGDWFGGSVAVGGDTAVVVACCEGAAGAAYVFEESAPTPAPTGTPTPRPCPTGNDDFEQGPVESNDIPCWTVVMQPGSSSGGWCNQAGTLAPRGFCAGTITTVLAPPQGLKAVMTNQFGPGSYVLYRCDDLASGLVSFDLYIKNQAFGFASPSTLDFTAVMNQQFRADLVTKAGMTADPFTIAPADILLNIYQTLGGDPQVSGYGLVTADGGAFVGQNVCLRFAVATNLTYFHAGIDDVQFDTTLKPTLTPTITPTPTPTKLAFPGDSDGDGCADIRENGSDPTLGGLRSHFDPWDFYDVAVGGGAPGTDGVIDLFNDITSVIEHYAPSGLEPEYDVAFDRGPSVGPNAWNMTAPDGNIDLFNDIVGVVAQAFHDCR